MARWEIQNNNNNRNSSMCKSNFKMAHDVQENNLDVEENGEEPEQPHVFQRLYDLEKRVQALRDTALSIEKEKMSVLASLQEIQDNGYMWTLSEEEKEEVEANAERLVCRCLTVEVSVTTPRNEMQENALQKVQELVSSVENSMNTNRDQAVSKANSYLSACLTEGSSKMMDHRFQEVLLGCTIDDQKTIKRHLQDMVEKYSKEEESKDL